MLSENSSFSSNALSLIFEEKILHISNCEFVEKYIEEISENDMKNKMICLSNNSIFILFNKLETSQQKIDYSSLKNIEIDLKDEKLIKINLINKNHDNIILSLSNRENFVKNLKKLCQINSIKQTGKLKELEIIFINNSSNHKTNNTENLNSSKTFLLKKLISSDNTFYSLNIYQFFLKGGFVKYENNLFVYPNTKGNQLSSKLIIDIQEEKPIEKLIIDDEYDMSYSSYRKYHSLMQKDFKLKKYWTLINTSYIKSFNINKDCSRWEGWTIKARTNRGLNLIFIFLRRKFIPPLCETYQDITLTILEEYKLEDTNFEISQEAIRIVEMVANSFTEKFLEPINPDCIQLIKMKIDHFLLDHFSYDHFINNLNIIGEHSYKIGLDITLKIILIIEEYSPEMGMKIKQRFLKRIQQAHKIFGDNYYEINNYEKTLKKKEFDDIFRTSDDYFKSFFVKCEAKDFEIWESKRWDFLTFCINGGLSFNLFTFNTIINVYKRKDDLKILKWLINKLLNLKIISTNSQLLAPNISSIVNSYNSIKELYFNEDVMAGLIENNIICKVQDLGSEYVLAHFFKFLVERNFSNKILNAIYFYLKLLSKKNQSEVKVDGILNELKSEENEKNKYNLYEMDSQSLKSELKIILPSLYSIYSNQNMCPIISTITCKCMNILVNFNFLNKTTLISLNCFEIISDYLSSADEKLIYSSIQLLTNLISETKENKKNFFNKYPKIFKNCLSIIKGHSVPGAYYSTKTIISVLNLILILIKIPTSNVKEELTGQEGKFFAKYFLNYLQSNYKTSPEDLSHPLVIQEKVIDVLYLLINKNFKFRNFLENNFRILEILDMKFKGLCDYARIGVLNIEKIDFNSQDNKNRHSKMITHSNKLVEEFLKFIFVVLKFLKKFISNDLSIVRQVKEKCYNLISAIMLIKENTKQEYFKFLISDAEDLYKTLYEDDKMFS